MEGISPFDSTALADIVLRSSDNVHFYVLRAFLSYVSPAFRVLFSLNQGSENKDEITDGYPVIPLGEDSKTIHCLLSLIHPYVNKPKLENGRLLIKVWKMAEKYGMDTVVGKLQKRLLKDRWMKDQPQRVFAIAIIFGWKDGTEKAKQILVSKRLVLYCKEFEEISGADYYELLEHRFCRENPKRRRKQQVATVGKDEDTSSDAVDFYLSRQFLQLVSPAFDKLFSDTQGSESKNGLNVVCITGHSKALHHFLLALHYRMDKPPVDDPGLIADICSMARKYEVPGIEARMKEQLTASSSLVEKPLHVYAVATALNWADLVRAAAKNTLNAPLEDAVVSIPELQRITGGDLYRLVNYRTKCGNVACKVIWDSKIHQEFGPGRLASHLFNHAPAGFVSSSSVHQVNDIEAKLRACPRGSTYADIFTQLNDVFGAEHGRKCWPVSSAVGFVRCCRLVAEAIEEEIDKIVIPVNDKGH